ncbi:MAG TPA: methyltransferase domain-containing protein [Phycisphaerae bacterium]|nr:methyltransferase domain-containing protein [Phycisphaerae bacterium]
MVSPESEDDGPLYGSDAAEALRRREASRAKDSDEKFALLLAAVRAGGRCRRLVDIGCGWGQFLAKVAEALPAVELWGVDESPERLKDAAGACARARVVLCRADRLALPDAHFDVAVASQVLHELKLFGRPGELAGALAEARRVLVPGGRFLLLDHLDAGDGEVTVRLPPPARARLAEFERKFRCYEAAHEDLPGGAVRITRRCLQDFLTKDWSLGTAMEPMEMAETHNVFRREETEALLASRGLEVLAWQSFADIRADLRRAGGQLVEGAPWFRKFLSSAIAILM